MACYYATAGESILPGTFPELRRHCLVSKPGIQEYTDVDTLLHDLKHSLRGYLKRHGVHTSVNAARTSAYATLSRGILRLRCNRAHYLILLQKPRSKAARFTAADFLQLGSFYRARSCV